MRFLGRNQYFDVQLECMWVHLRSHCLCDLPLDRLCISAGSEVEEGFEEATIGTGRDNILFHFSPGMMTKQICGESWLEKCRV